MWTEELWDLILRETNRCAQTVTACKPKGHVAKSLGKKPLTMDDFKAFFGLRVAKEMLLYKDRYEQYWRSKDSRICATPGFPEIMSRDRFLAIWSCLHAVDEDDPTLAQHY